MRRDQAGDDEFAGKIDRLRAGREALTSSGPTDSTLPSRTISAAFSIAGLPEPSMRRAPTKAFTRRKSRLAARKPVNSEGHEADAGK